MKEAVLARASAKAKLESTCRDHLAEQPLAWRGLGNVATSLFASTLKSAGARRMPSSRKQEELGHQLGVAAKTGNMSSVQSLLAAGAEKEVETFVSGMMMTPLNAAAYTNNVRSLCSLFVLHLT